MSFTKTHKTSTYLLGTLQKNKPTFIVLPYHFSPTLHMQQLTSCDELHVTRLQESHRNFFISNNDSSISTQVMHSSFGELTSKFRMSVLFAYHLDGAVITSSVCLYLDGTWSSPVPCAVCLHTNGTQSSSVPCAVCLHTDGAAIISSMCIHMDLAVITSSVCCVYTRMEHIHHQFCVYTWMKQSHHQFQII